MDLHPRVRSAAEELYRNGHYRNAILDSAVALVNLVKEKSRRHDLDGAALMRTVFSRTTPVLAFNNLADQSDLDEQEGLMHLFEGAVLAFRNPRAHDLAPDTPEYALECIGFLSMLAKKLDYEFYEIDQHPADGIDKHKLRREWGEFWLNGRPCALHPPAIRQMDRIWAAEDGKRAVRAGPRCARRGVRRPRLLGSSRRNHRNRAFEFLVAGRDAGSGRGRAQGARRVQVRGRRRGDERVVRDFAAARGSRRRVLRGLRHRHRRSCRPSGAARRAAVGMRFGGRGAAVARERGVDRRAARVMTFLPRSPSDGRHRTARCRRL